MRRPFLLILFLLSPLLAQTAPVTQPAASSTPVPLFHPIARAQIAGSIDQLTPIPATHRFLAVQLREEFDLGKAAAETWRWWLIPLLCLLWLIPIYRLFRRRHNRFIPGKEHCRRCRYCLDGIHSLTCPECGCNLTAANRILPPSRFRILALLLVWLTLLAGLLATLFHTSPRWESRISWSSASLMDLLTRNGFHDSAKDKNWTVDRHKIIELDPLTGRTVATLWEDHPGLEAGLCVSDDGRTAVVLVTPTPYANWRPHTLIDLPTGRQTPLKDIIDVDRLFIHSQQINVANFRLSIDGSKLFVWTIEGLIEQLDLKTARVTQIAAGPSLRRSNPTWTHPHALSQTAPDRLAAVATENGQADLTLYDLRDAHPLNHSQWPIIKWTPDDDATAIAITPERVYVVAAHNFTPNGEAGGGLRMLYVWDHRASRLLASWTLNAAVSYPTLLPNQNVLFFLNWGWGPTYDQIEARDALTGRLLATLDPHEHIDIQQIVLSADKKQLIALAYDPPPTTPWRTHVLAFDIASLTRPQ